MVGGPQATRPPPREEPQLEDISGYLQRLYQVEQIRHQLEAQLMTAVTNTTFQSAMRAYTSMGADEDPRQGSILQQTARDFEIIARRFEELSIRFHRGMPPIPNSCRRLHTNYALALTRMPRVVRGLRDALMRMDLGAVNMVQQFGQSTVDRGFQIADQEMERLCDERRMSKPFDIASGSRRSLLGP